MAEDLPDWRAKKELLWGAGAEASRQVGAGEAFLRAGRLPEALDAFERAKHAPGLRAVLKEAVDRGDWYLFKRVREALGEDSAAELRSLAGSAFEKGKHLHALRAAPALGDEALAAKALDKVKETFPDAVNLLRKLEEEAAPAEGPREPKGGPEARKKA